MRPLLDPQDEWLWDQFPWNQRAEGYWQRQGNPGTIYLHREILQAPPDAVVDHKNRNPNDNRRRNLRLTTQGLNMANARKRATHNRRRPTSRFKGVSWADWTSCWRVTCKGKHVGYFKSETRAARAYNEAAIDTFGEFARINTL